MTQKRENTCTAIEHFDTIDSTNAELKRRIMNSSLSSITAVSADVQTAGRGRRGRTWLNTEGSLMMSAAFPIDAMEPDSIPLISIAAALAAHSCIASAGVNAVIKWPNDIIVLHDVGYRKLAGILSELASAPDGRLFAVIGIGINVNSSSMPDGLMQPASSLLLEKGGPTDIGIMRSKLLEELILEVEQLKANAPALLARYKGNCITIGKQVEASFMDGVILEGEAMDLDERGRLLIKSDDRIIPIGAADVSVRFANNN